MKTTIVSCILAIFCFTNLHAQSNNTEVKSEKSDKVSPKKGIKTITIKTSSQCEMCKDLIEEALAFEKGIKSANLDVNSQILKVTYKEKKISADDIRQKISATGYDADKVKAKQAAHDELPKCCQKGGHSK